MSYGKRVMEIMKWMSEKWSFLSFIVTWLGFFKRSVGFWRMLSKCLHFCLIYHCLYTSLYFFFLFFFCFFFVSFVIPD